MNIKLCYVSDYIGSEMLNALQHYWSVLQKHSAYKKRFPGGDVNTFEDFTGIAAYRGNAMFLIIDTDNADIAGEFMLSDFTGLAAQIHVSANPKYYRKGLQITRQVFQEIFDMRKADGSEYVHTLLGLTPVTNKLSLKFNKKAGFKKIAVIPKAMYIHPDKYVDAVATMLTEEDLNGIER